MLDDGQGRRRLKSRWTKIVDVHVDVVERKLEEAWKVYVFEKLGPPLATGPQVHVIWIRK